MIDKAPLFGDCVFSVLEEIERGDWGFAFSQLVEELGLFENAR